MVVLRKKRDGQPLLGACKFKGQRGDYTLSGDSLLPRQILSPVKAGGNTVAFAEVTDKPTG